MRAGLEGTQDVRVHHDGHVALGNELLVASLHLVLHPVSEGPANECIRHVNDPLSRKLAKVVVVWEIDGRIGVLGRLLEELFEAEALVLRHGQVLYAVRVQELLGAHDDLLQEVDGDLL